MRSLALGGVLAALVIPATAQAWQFDRIEGEQYRITQGGFDGVEQRIQAVSDAWGPKVNFLQIFAEAEQATRALDGDPVSGAVTGFRWEAGNESEGDWRPQGITGSADAQDDGMWGPNKVLITSWHHEGNGPQTARITLHKTTDGNAGAPYRHVLLVVPKAGGDVDPVLSHAGGLAWVGRYLYVASTTHLKVFDLNDIIKVRDRHAELPGRYKYILPQSGSYDVTARPELKFSSVSVDRSREPEALVTSEFLDGHAAGGRIIRWPLGGLGLMGDYADSLGIWRARGIVDIQGALMRNGRFAVTSSWSSGNSKLYTGAQNQPSASARPTREWSLSGIQDLFYAPERDRLYSLTEFEDSRRVFAVDGSSVGL